MSSCASSSSVVPWNDPGSNNAWECRSALVSGERSRGARQGREEERKERCALRNEFQEFAYQESVCLPPNRSSIE